ncbi:MAG: membrane fusion protein (multidrug efflux system) [Gammaproteobacteria bacterium]
MAQEQTPANAQTTNPPEAAVTHSVVPRRGFFARMARGGLRIVLLAVGPLIIIIAGGIYYATSGRVIETENAYVKADHVLVSSDINGRIVEVYVRENETVHNDAPLFKIDPWPFKLELDQVDAELAAVKFDVSAYKAAYRLAKSELQVAKKNSAYLGREYNRRENLAKRSILPKAELADFRHRWQMSSERLGAIHEKIAQTLANLGGDENLDAEEHPRYRQLLAKRDQAALNLERTVVRSPTQGVVSNVDLQVGEYVEEGKPVFSLMSTSGMWIEANLKETQLTRIRQGQAAKVSVDAYPDYTWDATVASLSPGTGAEFSLLPPQNATGNWVKVVQRVPVRVEIVPNPDGPTLRAGMSVTVGIDTEYERPVPGFVASALAMVGFEKR